MDTTTETTPPQRTTLRPGWGAPPPQEILDAAQPPLAGWGARAIYREPTARYESRGPRGGKKGRYVDVPAGIDLLWDRQAAAGHNATLKALGSWIDKIALPQLRKECRLASWSEDTITIEGAAEGLRFILTASPNGSCGYLYIGAWALVIEA